jgi:hypothetical protein
MVNRRHVYRAKLAQVPWESVDVFTVFHEAGWHCEECGHETPQGLYGKNAWNSPELDHIIALVDGGPHKRSNVRLCCRRCNWRKAFAEGSILTGSRAFGAKLNTKIVKEILERRKACVGIGTLAQDYGVHKKTVRAVVLGRAWRHVNGGRPTPKGKPVKSVTASTAATEATA